MSHIESREQRAMRPLLNFFSHSANFKQLLDVVVFKTRRLPLRVLDWFVTNYAKKNDICYQIKRPNGTLETFLVYRSYLAQLKGSKKKEFDPFCRGATITLEYESPAGETSCATVGAEENEKVAFETALCQLKFFKWSIENLVLDYVESNFEAIYADMQQNSSKSQKTPVAANQPDRKKKIELSKSIYQQMHVSNQPVTFVF